MCRFASFHPLPEKWGEVSNISAARCGHWRRPSWYFNYRKFRWSPDIIQIDVCPWRALTTPGIFLVKFGTGFDDRSFQTGASHMKDHGFPKGDVSIQTPAAGDFIVWPHKNFPTVHNHHYTTGLIFWRISGIVSYI